MKKKPTNKKKYINKTFLSINCVEKSKPLKPIPKTSLVIYIQNKQFIQKDKQLNSLTLIQFSFLSI